MGISFKKVGFFGEALNAVPSILFVVDDDLRIRFRNLAAVSMLQEQTPYAKKLGDVVQCIHSTESREGCGHGPNCKNCVVRNSVNEAFTGKHVYRKRAIYEYYRESQKTSVPLLITAAPFTFMRRKLALLILEDIAELMEARALLPICANCKKIRNEANYWETVETYINDHLADIKFSHGICPKCIKKLYNINPNHL